MVPSVEEPSAVQTSAVPKATSSTGWPVISEKLAEVWGLPTVRPPAQFDEPERRVTRHEASTLSPGFAGLGRGDAAGDRRGAAGVLDHGGEASFEVQAGYREGIGDRQQRRALAEGEV